MGTALTAFAVVFVAELGDKTQLLLLALATRHATLPVTAGLLLGYGTTTVLAVALGAAIGNALPQTAVQVGSGVVFLAFAVWSVLGDPDDEQDTAEDGLGRSGIGLIVSIAGALIVSEIGDKSMLATATLASDGDPVPVALGAVAGILSSGALGVAAGRLLAGRIDPTVLRWASAGLFAVFGVAMLLEAV